MIGTIKKFLESQNPKWIKRWMMVRCYDQLPIYNIKSISSNKNRLQRENKKSIDMMSDQITYYQDLFDTVIANNRNTNQSIVREIRSNLLRLTILANPKMRAMYRDSKKSATLMSIKVSAHIITH